MGLDSNGIVASYFAICTERDSIRGSEAFLDSVPVFREIKFPQIPAVAAQSSAATMVAFGFVISYLSESFGSSQVASI